MARVHDSAGCRAFVSHKKLHVWTATVLLCPAETDASKEEGTGGRGEGGGAKGGAAKGALLWMARVHNSAGSRALVSHKQLHIWAGPLVPIQPGHVGGFNQPHVHHASWHLHSSF